MKRIFLDHAAGLQNPNSIHAEGRQAHATLESCKSAIARYIHAASPTQIILAPSATLANHFLLSEFPTVAASATDHHSILHHPHTTTLLPVDHLGRISAPLSLPASPDLVSISLANHEIGTIQDIKALAKSAHQRGALLHSDASAALTKIPIDVQALDLDYLTISGAKLAIPGIAALYAKTPIKKLYNFPFGTPNIPAISALQAALRQGSDLQKLYNFRIRPLRDHLATRLLTEIPSTTQNGATSKSHSLPNLLNISFAGAEGESILLMLDQLGIAVSTGSACALGQPSHVILAITSDPVAAHNSIRFSLGPDTTLDQINFTADKLKEIIKTLRSYTTQ